MEKGFISEKWLGDPLPQGEDPWVLTTAAPSVPGHRDACIGNGLIGTRINAWGDAAGYRPGSSSFMSGLWGAATDNPKRPNGAVELPHWATLTVSGGDRELRRPERVVSDHQQSLDLRTATVHTAWTEENTDGRLQITKEAWIARADRHVAVLSADVTLIEGNDRIFIDEELDCLHIPDTSENRTYLDGKDLCLELTSLKLNRQLVIRSRIIVEGLEPEHIAESASTGSHAARRRLRLGGMDYDKVFRVTKLVSIVSSKQETDPAVAAKRFLDEAEADRTALRARHEEAWKTIWEGRVESDNPRFQQLCNASLYHIYSSLRSDLKESHGPCGIFGNGWDSNVFWDTELWTLPAIALFSPGMARSCAAYRHATLPGARRNAEVNNEAGARFSWMSGDTGEECCSQRVFQEERHIVSCVALGQWLYVTAAGDKDWLRNEGLEVFRGCAEYWASRARFDEADGKWHILGVCGSDEHAGIVDDNATTNWGASWTLRTAARLVRESGDEPPAEWEQIADGLIILWDDERDIPLQMRQWEHGTVIKQADTTMLIHPWHFPMDDATMERTVDYYRAHYQDQPIMMGYAIDGIIDCRLGRKASVSETLARLLDYFRLPFLITSEAPTNERLPFLTGMGGFLQFVANGMAGLITDEPGGLESRWACLPDGIDSIRLHGVHHGGRRHTVEISRGTDGAASVQIEQQQ